MSTISGYPARSFDPSQKFLVLDPSTQTTALVLGSDLVSYITPSLDVVRTNTTRAAALNEDYEIGTFVQTAGGAAIDDGGNGMYLVVAAGDGDYAMLNGNELLLLPFGTLVGSDLDGALVTDDGVQVTIQSAIAKREVHFTSLAALLASTCTYDYVTVDAANEGGSTGRMELYNNGTTGTPTTNGNRFSALAAGTFFNAAGIGYSLAVDQDITPYIFGASGDGIDDDTVPVQTWLNYEGPLIGPKGNFLLTEHVSVVADRKVSISGVGAECRFFAADVSDAAFNPGYGSNAVMFRFDVADLCIENVAFDSVAAVSYTETSAVGNFIFTDQTTTAYAQKIKISGCYFSRAPNDAHYSGTFAGTGNDVYIELSGNHYFNSGRYDVTVQNAQQINITGNFSRDSGAGFDVEPNGASDVALMVVVAGNSIKNAQYNAIQVTIGAPNTGVAIVADNAISLSTSYVATVTQKQPITVRAQYASITGNTMYEGSCARLIDLISTTHAAITGNTMQATSASSAEFIRLTNSYAVMAGNFFGITGVTNYATTSGTSGYKTIDHMAVSMIMGGSFENVLNLYGSSGLNSRAIMAIDNLRIDSNGLAASEFIRLRTKNGGVIGLEITDSGGLGAPNLPTSSAGLPAGGLWVDTGAGNVIKRA